MYRNLKIFGYAVMIAATWTAISYAFCLKMKYESTDISSICQEHAATLESNHDVDKQNADLLCNPSLLAFAL